MPRSIAQQPPDAGAGGALLERQLRSLPFMASPDPPHGVLVIDKPIGPTSHDVVARLRRMLGTRAIGHAGTLDPAASGVLVVAVGEATKLCAYLTAETKRYQATVTFGAATTTLDAEGDVVASGPIPDALAAELRCLMSAMDAAPSGAAGNATGGPRASLAPNTHKAASRDAGLPHLDETTAVPALARALAIERARREQMPPAFSAIKIGGRTAYDMARRGQDVPLTPRAVEAHVIAIRGASAVAVELELRVSKGYYVRALARDLGDSLGVPSHLSALRRTASGSFTIDEALPWSASNEELTRALQSVERSAERVLGATILTEEGERKARMGQRLAPEHFSAVPGAGISAWFGPGGRLVAIGRAAEDGSYKVERGFAHATSNAST